VPAAGPAAVTAATPAAPRPRLRLILTALGVILASCFVLWMACALAVARVPRERAALEELLRHETGLEVAFSVLSVGWGWYGPEAVLHDVELGEPGTGAVLLRAPRLTVALDPWRMARSGRLEAGRILLESPDIMLGGGAARRGARGEAPPGGESAEALRILSRWRGGQIDIRGGTLRVPAQRGANAFTFGLRQLRLRRLGAAWDADVRVMLPESLGSDARLVVRMTADPAHPAALGGTLRFEGRQLELAGWRALLPATTSALLPQAGRGSLDLEAEVRNGQLSHASGRVRAEALEWGASSVGEGALAIAQLSGQWQLARRGGNWHLAVNALELGDGAPHAVSIAARGAPPAAAATVLTVDAAPDGEWLHAHIRHAPFALLAALLRGWAPQLPLAQLGLSGEVRELGFDFDSRARSGPRLSASADIRNLTLAGGQVTLAGLDADVSGADGNFLVQLAGEDARLSLPRAADRAGGSPAVLERLSVSALLGVHAQRGGWRVSTDNLTVRRAGMSLSASGSIGADAPGAPARINARAALKGVDAAMLAGALPPGALGSLAPVVAQLTAGRIESADLTWHGVLARAPGSGTEVPPQLRVAALLEDGEWHAVAGMPPLSALHGTLAFADGALQRSTLSGQWLGGAVSLIVQERGAHGLAVAARGVMSARQTLEAARANLEAARLTGSTEWSALLEVVPEPGAQRTHWQLRADSRLVGISSRLPEPFAKASGVALPLHLELTGSADAAALRVALGERLQAAAQLARSGDSWLVERGAVQLGSAAPELPADKVLRLDGHVGQLDLPAYLALWHLAGSDVALPALDATLSADELLAGSRSYAGVTLSAQAGSGGGTLELRSDVLAASARWPAVIDGANPALVHLASFNLMRPADAALAAPLATVLAPAARLVIDDLEWQGHALGSLAARLDSRAGELEVSELSLSGASGATVARGRCDSTVCRATFNLDSPDVAATLAAFGLRAEVSAQRARLAGELRWSPHAIAPLATLSGSLHMQMQEGETRAAEPGGGSFALLSVPALLAGMSPEGPDAAPSALHFQRLTADYQLEDGVAATDLHFDGDAEILLRGHVGLVAGDYDEEAQVLRGEERLPAAVRGLGATPRVAALWLSLRELFGGEPVERVRTLHLRGSWNDPIVIAGE
jgi:uncharacterized protein YhdP